MPQAFHPVPPRGPFHQRQVEVVATGAKLRAYLHRSVDERESSRRNVVVMADPVEAAKALPPDLRARWEAFTAEVSRKQREWRMSAVPTMKRILREHQAGKLLEGWDILAVAHHHGSVPALILERSDALCFGIFPATLVTASNHAPYNDDEQWEILHSFRNALPNLFDSYFENISYYLRAIFFSKKSSDKRTLQYCLRIRNIITTSIRKKIDLIRNCPRAATRSRPLACALQRRFAREIRTAEAVDAFAHLLVNYIYKFFCLDDRTDRYHRKLQRIRSETDIFGLDLVGYLKQAGKNITHLRDDFLTELAEEKDEVPQWLYSLSEVGAMVGEILHATGESPIDTPKVFFSHDFGLPESEEVFRHIHAWREKHAIPTALIRGRHLRNSNLLWAILARIWMCDHHVIFLPASRTLPDGREKPLRDRDDWLLQELFYARLLGHPISMLVSARATHETIAGFRDHIARYNEAREITQIEQVIWDNFVGPAKSELQEEAMKNHHLRPDFARRDQVFFTEFHEKVVRQAALRLTASLLNAWCYFFDPIPWSIVQALIEMGAPETEREQGSTVRELAEYLRASHTDPRFAWTDAHATRDQLEEAIRRHLRNVKTFAFRLAGRRFHPVKSARCGRVLRVRCRFATLLAALEKRFGAALSLAEKRELRERVLATRK